MVNYNDKYLKYKLKYLLFKNKYLVGGTDPIYKVFQDKDLTLKYFTLEPITYSEIENGEPLEEGAYVLVIKNKEYNAKMASLYLSPTSITIKVLLYKNDSSLKTYEQPSIIFNQEQKIEIKMLEIIFLII